MKQVVEFIKSAIASFLVGCIKFGQWIRLLDDQGQVSLTNIAMWVALYKLITATSAGWTEVGTLLLALASYQVKRSGLLDVLPEDVTQEATDITGQLDDLKSKINAILIGKGLGK